MAGTYFHSHARDLEKGGLVAGEADKYHRDYSYQVAEDVQAAPAGAVVVTFSSQLQSRDVEGVEDGENLWR